MPRTVEHPDLKVSVIIPTYNRAYYLREALDSVFAQSLLPWEVIVVDDGSTDATPAVVQSYGSRVRYIRHEQNQRISAARNSGLKVAQGDVIAWLDSDDLWEPTFLATVISLLEADATFGAVYTGLSRINAVGEFLPQGSLTVVPPSDLYSVLVEDCFIQTSAFVARKKCFEQIGEFDTQFHICEDYDIFLRLASVCTIVGIPEPLVRYRVHGHNTVANTEAFCRYRLALTEKHFGLSEGDPATWSLAKRRAHGCAFRAAARKYIESKQQDEGWRYLARAVTICPELLNRLDTFYELACGDQAMGYRGKADMLDIAANGMEMVRRLDALFANAPKSVLILRRVAYGNAFLALAVLSDQAGDWKAARGYLFRAIRSQLGLLQDPLVVRRFVKLCLGKRIIDFLRHLRATVGTSLRS